MAMNLNITLVVINMMKYVINSDISKENKIVSFTPEQRTPKKKPVI